MFDALSLPWVVAGFFVLAAIIAFSGVRLVRVADRLADLTGWGEAIFGAVLLGGMTSLAGIVTSVSAARAGQAELSVGNAIGGIAAQTFFLAIADLAYKRANLEHASASLLNIMLATLLTAQLGWVMLTMAMPDWTLWHVHIGSLLLLVVYLIGLRVIRQARDVPMWHPTTTRETVPDKPEETEISTSNLTALWLSFALLAVIVGLAGYGVAEAGIRISNATGLNATFVGALFTAVATSLPELVVVVSAARQGALTLAVGNIIGGNAFDVLFVAFADIGYLPGAIYADVGERSSFIIALALIMTAVLLFGMLFRQRYGPGRIGWESILLFVLFLAGYAVLAFR